MMCKSKFYNTFNFLLTARLYLSSLKELYPSIYILRLFAHLYSFPKKCHLAIQLTISHVKQIGLIQLSGIDTQSVRFHENLRNAPAIPAMQVKFQILSGFLFFIFI